MRIPQLHNGKFGYLASGRIHLRGCGSQAFLPGKFGQHFIRLRLKSLLTPSIRRVRKVRPCSSFA
jgi:hypothetical protein